MIKYKRFRKENIDESQIERFFNELTTEGWEIIYYDENINETIKTLIKDLVVVAKKSSNLL
jgi:hypothetical protein